ncbi:hypothetical protein Athai_58650 [Actinocatenispora thailandica]|uniref:Uncharacterized protein n=1 Tax=Actinocatenispora thailandica TaxID=227318 RepID=A0A7R7HZH4_9ACTN|nr:hypothetical protein Athai_58650 [Actinocatenispora thailandica]
MKGVQLPLQLLDSDTFRHPWTGKGRWYFDGRNQISFDIGTWAGNDCAFADFVDGKWTINFSIGDPDEGKTFTFRRS